MNFLGIAAILGFLIVPIVIVVARIRYKPDQEHRKDQNDNCERESLFSGYGTINDDMKWTVGSDEHKTIDMENTGDPL